jgi:hypothetical protein
MAWIRFQSGVPSSKRMQKCFCAFSRLLRVEVSRRHKCTYPFGLQNFWCGALSLDLGAPPTALQDYIYEDISRFCLQVHTILIHFM